jgi:hypothetical protein
MKPKVHSTGNDLKKEQGRVHSAGAVLYENIKKSHKSKMKLQLRLGKQHRWRSPGGGSLSIATYAPRAFSLKIIGPWPYCGLHVLMPTPYCGLGIGQGTPFCRHAQMFKGRTATAYTVNLVKVYPFWARRNRSSDFWSRDHKYWSLLRDRACFVGLSAPARARFVRQKNTP